MTRFSELIDAAADPKNHKLSDVLLRAKVVAARIRGRKFRAWVDAEINGYPSRQDLPEYRVLSSTIQGHYAGPFGMEARFVPISTAHLPADRREQFETAPMLNGISHIEDLIEGDEEDTQFIGG